MVSTIGAELDRAYANRFAGMESRRRRVWEVLNRHFLQERIRTEDTVLDIGAGYCEFINCVHARSKYAIDLNPATVRAAGKDVRVVSQDVTETWNLGSSSIDVAFSSNFLEHLPTKGGLMHCLRETYRVLRPGGLFIALGPNIRFCYRVYWDYFDHYLPLSDRSLVEALELVGFSSELVIPRFLPYTMKGKLPSHPLLVRLYLLFPLAWRIWGRQFLVVARKPNA